MKKSLFVWQCLLLALAGCQTASERSAATIEPLSPPSAWNGNKSTSGWSPPENEKPRSANIQPVAQVEIQSPRHRPVKFAEHVVKEEIELVQLPPAPPSESGSESESPLAPESGFGSESDKDARLGERVFTLAELEQMAVERNPAASEAAARAQALRGKYLQVGLPPNPTAGYVGSEIGNDGRAGQEGGFVGQQFITGNKLGLNRAVAAQEVQKADREWAAARQRVTTDVQLAYYELLIAQERLAMTEKLAKASQQAVEAVQALLKAKEATGTDLLQAQVEAGTVSMLLENARTARLGAWRRLAAILGNPEMDIARVTGDASKDLPMLDYESSLARLLAENPQRGAMFAEVERARWAISRARAEVCSDIDVMASVQRDYGSDYTIAGVQIGLPIPIINRNQGGIQQAHGELIAAQHAVNRFDLALKRRLAEVYQQYATAKQQVDLYSSDILPKADESLRLTTEGYRTGEFNFLQLLTAERTYFQTNLAYLDALGQMWAASRQIEGLLLSDSLENGPKGQ